MKRKKPGTDLCACGQPKMQTRLVCFRCVGQASGWKRSHHAQRKPRPAIGYTQVIPRYELNHDPIAARVRWSQAVQR